MNAIIMAAGPSTRFAPLSYEKPKGLLKVKGEVLIERQIRQLLEAGITEIIVIVGYKADMFRYLEDKFGVPVFINNDGDLFAYGEALGGVLPEVNAKLEALGSNKRYKNMIGYTFGTGFGVGMIVDGKLNK